MRIDRICLIRPEKSEPLSQTACGEESCLLRDDTLSIEYHDVSTPTPLHCHDCYELEIVFGGAGENRIADWRLPFQRGTVTLLSPAEMHAFYPDERTRLLSVKFTDMLSAPETGDLRSIAFPFAAQLSEDETRRVERHLELLREELNAAGSEGARRRLGSNFTGWLLGCVLSRADTAADEAAPSAEVILRVVEYVRGEYLRPLTLSGTAALFGYTPGHLSVLFRRTTGLSFCDYVCMLRLERARGLLEQTDAPIQRVAELSGFQSLSYFTRRFKRALGCAPAQYRENHRFVQTHPSFRH